jgi:TRAP-type C4-dicarboxylate transport system permease small subunit
MEPVERFVNSLSKYCDRVSQFGVFGMMALVASNIVLRLVWHPINGVYDYVSFIGAVLVAFALSYTALLKGHIEIEMLTEHFPRKVQDVLASIVGIISLGFFLIVTWQTVLYANIMMQKGETTMTALLPFHYYIYAMAFGLAVLCLVIFINFVKSMMKVVRG